jgi:xanthine/uracil/vitamin C permease (AzgA family)
MALYARYPIAQAPGMGENFFLVFSALPAATAAGFRQWVPGRAWHGVRFRCALFGIPFSYSIADGLALGFISYAVVKGFSGRAREISWLHLPARDCAGGVLRLCAKPNGLADTSSVRAVLNEEGRRHSAPYDMS